MTLRKQLSIAVLIPLSLSLLAADWPRFRGPNGSGVSDSKGLPLEWSAESNIAWKTELPGPGSSSPVIFGDKVFVTCYSGYGAEQGNPGDQANLKYHVLCVNLGDGRVLWDKSVDSRNQVTPYGSFIGMHGYASSTPAVDKDGVFALFGNSGASAWSHEGSQLWSKDLSQRIHSWGSGASPVLYKDVVILNTSAENGSLVALSKKTGEQVWQQGGMPMSWNTPVLAEANGGQELVLSVQGALKAFDPAKGTALWTCAGINDYVCPSVVTSDGVVYAIGGRQNTAVAVRAGGKGDVTNTHALWRVGKGSNVSSPVYHDGYLYWCHEERGTVYCVNAKTGEIAFEKPLTPSPGKIYASALVADGRIYCVSRNGGTYVLAAKPEFQLLAHNVISTDKTVFNASPAVGDGQILLRSDRFLYCIGKK
jgi:outer membrane protein assembly factor BamB